MAVALASMASRLIATAFAAVFLLLCDAGTPLVQVSAHPVDHHVATLRRGAGDGLPMLCQGERHHGRGARALVEGEMDGTLSALEVASSVESSSSVSLSSCGKDGGDGCGVELTIKPRKPDKKDNGNAAAGPGVAGSAVDVDAEAKALKTVNWTTPAPTEATECNVCRAALEEINSFCHALGSGEIDAADTDEAGKKQKQKRGADFNTAGIFEAGLKQAGWSGKQRQSAMHTYRAVVATFCPADPCTQAFRAKTNPDTICRGPLIDCSDSSADSTTQSGGAQESIRTSVPPEQATYRGHGVNFVFSPPRPLPPLSCAEYVGHFQTAVCSGAGVPQSTACNVFEGFKRDGCDLVARSLLLSRGPSSFDICPALFAAPSVEPLSTSLPSSSSSLTPPSSTDTPSPLDPSTVCSDVLGLPDQSPVPAKAWVAHLQEIRQKRAQEEDAAAAAAASAGEADDASGTGGSATEVVEHPCVDAPTPTPIPRGVVKLFDLPPGFETAMRGNGLISFSCDATSSWTDVRPRVGCAIPQFSQKQAGFGEPGMTQRCTCQVVGSPLPPVSWTDVTSASDCAQMICNRKHRFTQCAWDGVVVSTQGAWNGDSVTFKSSDRPCLRCRGPT